MKRQSNIKSLVSQLDKAQLRNLNAWLKAGNGRSEPEREAFVKQLLRVEDEPEDQGYYDEIIAEERAILNEARNPDICR